MKNYVFIYYNSKPNQKVSDEVNQAWMDWFKDMGNKVVDAGNPFNSGAKAVDKSGVMTVKDMPATGYSIVKASNMDEAVELSKGCPVLNAPGAVCVYETLPM